MTVSPEWRLSRSLKWRFAVPYGERQSVLDQAVSVVRSQVDILSPHYGVRPGLCEMWAVILWVETNLCSING